MNSILSPNKSSLHQPRSRSLEARGERRWGGSLVMLVMLSMLVAPMIALVTGCSADSDERVMTIEHYLVPCQGVGPRLCMLTGEPGSAEQSFFYSGIDGFQFEWGHRYELRVEVTEVPDPPADGSSLDYSLIELVRDETVDERFELRLDKDFLASEPSTGGFSLVGQRDIQCAQTAVCDAITAALVAQEAILVELSHGATESDPLLAHSTRAPAQ